MKILALALLLAAPVLCETTFQATLARPFWKDKRGELRFTAEAVEFHPNGEKDFSKWDFPDIQLLDRVSPTEIRLLTYEDMRWQLGRDRTLHFILESGSLTDSLFDEVEAKLERPAANRVLSGLTAPTGRLPAKHLHPMGGCEGELLFFPDRVAFDSEQDKHDREWKLGEQLESVWSSDPFELEFLTREPRASMWRFKLKRRLDAQVYKTLTLRLYDLTEEFPSRTRWPAHDGGIAKDR
jgi:hypothetical protein